MENALIEQAIAAGKVTKCPPGMAAEALQFGAHFMRDKFGEMAPGLIEERQGNGAPSFSAWRKSGLSARG